MLTPEKVQQEIQQLANIWDKRVPTTKEWAREYALRWWLKNSNKPKEQLRKETNRLYAILKKVQAGKATDAEFDKLILELNVPSIEHAKAFLSARYDVLKEI